MAFLGGLGTVAGPVLGALIIEPAQQYFTQQFPNAFLSQITLGAVFMAVIVLIPRGLIPTVGEKMTSWRAKRARRAAAAIQMAGTRPAALAVEPGPAADASTRKNLR